MASRWHHNGIARMHPTKCHSWWFFVFVFVILHCNFAVSNEKTLSLGHADLQDEQKRLALPAKGGENRQGCRDAGMQGCRDAGMQGCILAHLHSCFTWNYDCVVLTLYEHLWMQKLELNKTNKMCFLGSTMLLPHANRSNIWNCIVQNWRRPGRVI